MSLFGAVIDTIDHAPRAFTVPTMFGTAAFTAFMASKGMDALIPYVQNGGSLLDPAVVELAMSTAKCFSTAGITSMIGGSIVGKALAERFNRGSALSSAEERKAPYFEPVLQHAPGQEQARWDDDPRGMG